VLALVTILDGANALMFHMEHCLRSWEYRARWPDSGVEGLRDWQRTRTVAGDSAALVLADLTAGLEVEWRWFEKDEDGPWEAAVPHVFGEAEASFVVELLAERDFGPDPAIRAMAMVRGYPACFDIQVPKRRYPAGAVIAARGAAVNRGPGVVLREPGEFACGNAAFRISNVAASQGALLAAPQGPSLPGENPFRGGFFVKAGRLAPDEIELLLQSCPKS